jgi:hypothetical protein
LLALFKRIHLIIGEWLPALNFSVALYDEHCAQLNFPITLMTTNCSPSNRAPSPGVCVPKWSAAVSRFC